jgi:hypothetical protein
LESGESGLLGPHPANIKRGKARGSQKLARIPDPMTWCHDGQTITNITTDGPSSVAVPLKG